MKTKTIPLLFIASLLLSGCSTTLPLNYVPAAAVKGSGNVSVGEVHYIPYEKGDVEKDQFQEASLAIGDIYVSEPVSDLIKTALRKELIAGGFTVSPKAKTVIEADVTRFTYDWIGFIEVDFYLDIDFKILQNGVTLWTHKASAHQKAPKTMMSDTEAMRAAISKCIDDFFLQAQAKGLL